jgi:hypothetical protein
MSFHYVYILESVTNPDHFYVGLTEDLHDRLHKHNAGEVSQLRSSNLGPLRPQWLFATLTALPRLSVISSQVPAAPSHENISEPGFGSACQFIAGSSNRRTAPFEGANAGAIPAPAASFGKSSFDPPDGETGSCLSYKEMLRVQFLLGRPIASLHNQECAGL